MERMALKSWEVDEREGLIPTEQNRGAQFLRAGFSELRMATHAERAVVIRT
jgi:hypothetical protein